MINADAGVFLALEKGYFREQGLAVELNYFASSGGLQMAALTTGELDVGSGSISPGIYNAVAGGVNMRVVASKSRVGPQAGGKYMVRRSLLDASQPLPIQDSKGRGVALKSVGGWTRL